MISSCGNNQTWKLRREEIDWLARRDAIRDVLDRTTFVRKRVKELEKRLGRL